MDADVKMRVVGFGVKHKFTDANGKIHSFAQKYKYIPMNCPKCKKKSIFLYPAINQCDGCKTLLPFCALNDGDNRLGIFDIDTLKEVVV